MAGINIIFDRNEYIDHGRYNAQYYNEDPQSSWAFKVHLIEVPMEGLDENLFVILEEHNNHTELETMYLADTPEDDDKRYIGGGWTGGHIREDNKLSLGTPYKAFSVELAYLASFQYMMKNGAIRIDEADDAFDEDDVAERTEYERCCHRVNHTFGTEVRKGHTAM
jgi:hypothetical protein